MNNESFIRRISNGDIVDLSKLSSPELQRLHYEEERYVAKKMCEMKPFSKERYYLMQQGYSIIRPIMALYRSSDNTTYGANNKSVQLVCDFIEKLQSTEQCLYIYEAGVGTGFSCERFLRYSNVAVKGCDVVIYDKVKQLSAEYSNLHVDKDTLYNSLKNVEDGSVDIFYADNVIEHLFPDEFSQILALLSRKMKKSGLLILVIPNRYVGPSDVSKYFVARGEKAEGFHLMEMSYRETLTKFKEAGFSPKYFLFWGKNKIKYVKDIGGILNFLKVYIESFFGLFTKRLDRVGNRIFNAMALSYYILEKK